MLEENMPKNGELWNSDTFGLVKVWCVDVQNMDNVEDDKRYICYQAWTTNEKQGFYIKETIRFMREFYKYDI